jgi:hypothetical protein
MNEGKQGIGQGQRNVTPAENSGQSRNTESRVERQHGEMDGRDGQLSDARRRQIETERNQHNGGQR